jgi:hypothetical protein
MKSEPDAYSQYLNKICCLEHVMQKTLKFGGLIVAAVLAASIIAALSFTTMYAAAQNATSGKNTTVGNMTGGSTAASSSSCGSGSTASSCYDLGYQNALANPGKTCPSGHSYNYCAGWAHAREKR